MRSWFALWFLPTLLVACSVDASDLALTARIPEASIAVTDGAFGGLQGSFRLELSLGSEASGSTQVTGADFQLQSEAGESLAELDDAVPAPMFPIDLNKGDKKQVLFTLDGIGVDRATACAGRVRIVGSVTDTLKGGAVSVQSELLTPDCS